MTFSALCSWNAAIAQMAPMPTPQKINMDAPIFIETCMRVILP